MALAVTNANRLVGLPGARHAVGSVQLVLGPPGTAPVPSNKQDNHGEHTDAEDKQPVWPAALPRWRLVVDNKPLIATLNNRIALPINVAHGAARHPARLTWVVQPVSDV